MFFEVVLVPKIRFLITLEGFIETFELFLSAPFRSTTVVTLTHVCMAHKQRVELKRMRRSRLNVRIACGKLLAAFSFACGAIF